MDRQIVYPGAIPQDTDLLLTNKNTMVGLGYLMQAVLGTATLVDGLACTPTSPATLGVNVATGSIYSLAQIDATAYGSLSSDTTDQIVKQGIVLGTTNFSCPAPGTSGQSVVYLIEATYQDVDGGSAVLPYYNAANPSVAYSGPNNTGTSQNTVRKGVCTLAIKTGVAATTGSQVTPSPDAGYTGLYAITVANGQTTVTSGNIVQLSTAPFISPKLPNLVASLQPGGSNYAVDTSGVANTITVAFSPPLTSLVAGQPMRIKVANTNLSNVVINPNGLGNVTATMQDGTNIPLGVLQANGVYTFIYDGSHLQLQGPTQAILQDNAAQFQYTSTTVCTLIPKRGNKVSFPSGAVAVIPSAGISSTITSCYLNGTAASSLSASTLYYAYLWNSGSGYVIDWSTTVYQADTTTGIMIKNGDASRVLVGMAYPLTGPVFNYSAGEKLVRSWFNDLGISIANQYSTNRSTTSTSATEINNEIRATCLLWSNETVHVMVAGVASNSTAGDTVTTGIGVNSTSSMAAGQTQGTSSSSNYAFPAVAGLDYQGATEGINYFALLGYVNAGTGTWTGSQTYLGISTRRIP